MLTLSAFADEIDPDPVVQVHSLRKCRISFIELRSIHSINVLDLTDPQVDEFALLLQRNGLGISAIASPLGKSGIEEPFETQLPRLDRAIALARRFNTVNIRIFSFYRAENSGEQVHNRLRIMVERAMKAGVRLLHENEQGIYGESPERVADLLANVPGLYCAYDPANFVVTGHDPWAGWLACRDRTVHLHMKDWIRGEDHGRKVGEGHGRIRDVLRDVVNRGYDGFATLEPHLLGGGQMGGHTGPELFPEAVAALRTLIQEAGGVERAI